MEIIKENKMETIIRKELRKMYLKRKYFLNINLKSYKNIFSNEIKNISPFFEIEVNNRNNF